MYFKTITSITSMDFNWCLYDKKGKRKIIKEKIQIQHDFKKYTPVLKKNP